MQPVPGGLFQKLQQQGEAQAEEPDFELGTQSRGGRRVQSTPSEESSRSDSFPSGRRPRPWKPSTPSSIEAERSRQESPRKSSAVLAGGGISRDELAPSQATAVERQKSRQGASVSSSWSRSATTIPSQLMGGSAGADASVLAPSPDSLAEYRSQMRALIASTPCMHVTSPPNPTLPLPTGSQQSQHSFSTTSSITSGESYASSFAYSLRRSKPDLRLLRKRSKPSQHLSPKPSIQIVAARSSHSPSFYSPKVVEDTGLIESTTKELTPPTPLAEPLSFTLPEVLKSEPPIRPLGKVQTFRKNCAQSKRKIPAMTLNLTTSRPTLPRATSSQQLAAHTVPSTSPMHLAGKASRQLRFETPVRLLRDAPTAPVLKSTSQDLRKTGLPSGAGLNKHFDKQYGMKSTMRTNHDAAALEEQPGAARPWELVRGDSYFSAWGSETMSIKEFVPVPTPGESVKYAGRVAAGSRGPVSMIPRDGAAQASGLSRRATGLWTVSNSKKRKASALFGLFRKAAFREEVNYSESGKRDQPRRSQPVSDSTAVTTARIATPGITISGPADSKHLRQPSIVPELHAPSYFARPKIHRGDSEQSVARSPGHAWSGHAPSDEVLLEDMPATPHPSRSRRRNRSSSEALSPTALPRRSPRLRHKSTLASSSDSYGTEAQVSPDRLPFSDVASEADMNVKDMEATSATNRSNMKAMEVAIGVNSATTDLREQKSQTLTFEEPILRKRHSGWKGVLRKLREISSLGALNHSVRGFDEERRHHKAFALAKISFPSLRSRASRSSINVRHRKLVRKASHSSHLLQQVDSEDEAGLPEDEHEKLAEIRHSQTSPKCLMPPVIAAEDLVVTDFKQTPFCKRYYDSVRAEQQAIRALVDETMEEDDEADDEVVLGFEQNVPDHLPNSPLCPLHPKHKSGGKAICPSHGRYKLEKPQPSPLHKVEIVFDTREDVAQPGIGTDGPGLLVGKMGVMAQSFHNPERRRIQTSSMGSDGTESFMVQIKVSDAWARRHEQTRSGHRGRSLERGESSVDIRIRRHQQRRR